MSNTLCAVLKQQQTDRLGNVLSVPPLRGVGSSRREAEGRRPGLLWSRSLSVGLLLSLPSCTSLRLLAHSRGKQHPSTHFQASVNYAIALINKQTTVQVRRDAELCKLIGRHGCYVYARYTTVGNQSDGSV